MDDDCVVRRMLEVDQAAVAYVRIGVRVSDTEAESLSHSYGVLLTWNEATVRRINTLAIPFVVDS